MFKSKEVKIDNEKVTVRELSAGERRELIDSAKEGINDTELSAKMIKAGCEKYRSSSIDDIMGLPGSVFDELSGAISKLSGMSADEEKKD